MKPTVLLMLTSLLIVATPAVPSAQERGALALIYYWKAKPGQLASYNRYIREVAEPIDEEARRRGAFLSVTTFVSQKIDGPWTHLRVFVLRDKAQLDALSRALDAAGAALEPDEAKRKARSEYAATLRDFVAQEVVEILGPQDSVQRPHGDRIRLGADRDDRARDHALPVVVQLEAQPDVDAADLQEAPAEGAAGEHRAREFREEPAAPDEHRAGLPAEHDDLVGAVPSADI